MLLSRLFFLAYASAAVFPTSTESSISTDTINHAKFNTSFEATLSSKSLALKEFESLKLDLENLKLSVAETLAVGPYVGHYDIDGLKARTVTCVFACYLSRLISDFQRTQLLQISEEISGMIMDYMEMMDPFKYPRASPHERDIFTHMVALLDSYKRKLLDILFHAGREPQISITETQPIMKRVLSIRANLHGYYTEFDPEYRRAVMLEMFVSQLVTYLNQGSQDFGGPSGIHLLLAQQSKRHLLELSYVFNDMTIFEVEDNVKKTFELESTMFEEVGLISLFGFTNGVISSEIDTLLRGIRGEFIRLGLHSEYFDDNILRRLEHRFLKVELSIQQVLSITIQEREQDKILPGQKAVRYMRLDSPLSNYFLSFTKWVDEFFAWNFDSSAKTLVVYSLIERIEPQISHLKAIGRVLPQQAFWNDY